MIMNDSKTSRSFVPNTSRMMAARIHFVVMEDSLITSRGGFRASFGCFFE
jgi:hypothetical protein